MYAFLLYDRLPYKPPNRPLKVIVDVKALTSGDGLPSSLKTDAQSKHNQVVKLTSKSYSKEKAFLTPCQPSTLFFGKTSVPSSSSSFRLNKNAGKKHRVWFSFRRLMNIILIINTTIQLLNNRQ